MIRAVIGIQEMADQQLDQLQLKLCVLMKSHLWSQNPL